MTRRFTRLAVPALLLAVCLPGMAEAQLFKKAKAKKAARQVQRTQQAHDFGTIYGPPQRQNVGGIGMQDTRMRSNRIPITRYGTFSSTNAMNRTTTPGYQVNVPARQPYTSNGLQFIPQTQWNPRQTPYIQMPAGVHGGLLP